MRSRTRKLTILALLAALSSVIMQLEFNLPFIPPFLKFDFSLSIVSIGSLAIGPIAVLPLALIKALFNAMLGGNWVGSLADFIITVSFALPLAIIYRRQETRFHTIIGVITGTLVMVTAAALANYYILLPFYSATMMPIDKILDVCAKVNPLIVDKFTYILYAVIPFNLIKAISISVISLGLFRVLEKTPVFGDFDKVELPKTESSEIENISSE